MKKIFTYLCLAGACLVAFSSCNKEALSKYEVEAGFKAKGPVPTVTIDSNVEVYITVATVKITVSGITAESADSLSIGLLSSPDPTFYTSNFSPAEKLEDGTYAIQCNVTPNSKAYFRAVAANINGTNYSETVEKQIPDVPLWAKLSGVYTGTEASGLYSDVYKNQIVIEVDEDDHTKVIIGNIEPFYASQGALYSKGYNYAEGVLDEEKGTITIPCFTPTRIYAGYVFVGLNTNSIKTATDFCDLVFKVQSDGSIVREMAMGTYIPEKDKFDDAYEGGAVYKK